ncbi:unnamed protein product [Polarella glacialis]|uniref:Uncharacterized protein n=1 Tax=Polarella glacialis TaxID=89957 RepID=A0A813HJ57_POLGL|nr:unnamed protein product [Polarella glacialis]
MAAFIRSEDADGGRRVAQAMRRLGRWPRAWATALLARQLAGAGDHAAVEELLAELRAARCSPDAPCLRAQLAAYARAAQPPADGRVEACFQQLLQLKAERSAAEDPEVLGDLRRALGRQRFESLSSELGLHTSPLIRREAHARNRVVGRWGEVLPCE